MSLVIAVVLGIIVFFAKMNDSVKKSTYEAERRAKQGLRQSFMDEYTDDKLETHVRAFIENPLYREQVNQELEKALSEMKYQGKYRLLSLSRREKGDILLANRGKVSKFAEAFGYECKRYRKVNGRYVRDFDGELEQYGFMVWLQNTLRKQGKNVELVVKKSSHTDIPHEYAWKGSLHEQMNSEEPRIRLDDYNPQTHWTNQPIDPVT